MLDNLPSEGFSGAEIEQVVVAGLYSAIGAELEIDSALLADEIAQTKPLSKVMSEKIVALREWAADRTVAAN